MIFDLLLKRTCLKPNNSLRRQLLCSFGSSALFTLTIVVLLSCLAVYRAGELVKDRAGQVMRHQVHGNVIDTTRSVAERFSRYRETLEGVAELVAEVVADRIVGYPVASTATEDDNSTSSANSDWQDDVHVPFFDMDSGRNVYPLQIPPVPLDWNMYLYANFSQNIQLARELVQERHVLASSTESFVSPHNASWFVQGLCDPNATEDSSAAYYNNCTDANNNMTTGGVVQPTSTANGLYRVSGDIAAFFRPLYESHPDVLSIAVCFQNQGAGASLHYPGVLRSTDGEHYISQGCDWMRQINTHTDLPFGTEDEIARCHVKGTRVAPRDYNPLEREVYQQLALGQGKIVWYGPYRAVASGMLMMAVGRGIFDRRTGSLIGVVGINMAMTTVNEQLKESLVFAGSALGIVKISDGTVLSDTLGTREGTTSHSSSSVSEASDEELRGLHLWDDEYSLLEHGDFYKFNQTISKFFGTNTDWTAESAHEEIASALVTDCNEHVIMAYPIPLPPDVYSADYKPDLLVFHAILADQVFQPIAELHESVNNDVLYCSLTTLALGLAGLVVILVIIWCVSRMLTQPLLWMERISWRIVNHTNEVSGGDQLPFLDDDNNLTATVYCSPNTEITLLVSEFRKMIKGFSGEGASSVSEEELNEFSNQLTWQSEFRQLYTRDGSNDDNNNNNSGNPGGVVADFGGAGGGGGGGLQEKSCSFRDTTILSKNSPATGGTEEASSVSDPSESYNDQRQLIIGRPDDGRATTMKNSDHHISAPLGSSLRKQHQQQPLPVYPAPPRQHYGPNVLQSARGTSKPAFDTDIQVTRSLLFRWLFLLIVIPLILANCAICLVVSFKILGIVDEWVYQVAEQSVELSTQALSSIARSKANLVELTVIPPIRDLHLMSRMYAWLIFGAIPRSMTFTAVEQVSEECKYHAPDTCPFLKSDRAPCSCGWKDAPTIGTCQIINDEKARAIQKRFFLAQALDYDTATGNRFNVTSMPKSPEETRWWTDVSAMPGAYKGSNASGYVTMYDRLRVSSSFAVVDFPLYNYQVASGRPRYQIGTHVSFEADGMDSGFLGCSYDYTAAAFFPSNNDTLAFEIAPTLCPKGRYGFDPRCRDWYAATRKLYYESNGSATVRITAPYAFATRTEMGLSISAAIANPKTNEFVGEALLDFSPIGLHESLSRIQQTFSVLISPEKDKYGGDTVEGPDETVKWQSASIVDLMFGYDAQGSRERVFFEDEVLSKMKNGTSGLETFSRSKKDGTKEELKLAFEPVYGRYLAPIDPSDISRGVNYTYKHIYSYGIAIKKGMLMAPFEMAKNNVYGDMNRLAAIDIAVVLFFSILFIVFTCRISIHVSRPMIVLLQVVQNINSGEIENDIPPLNGGSRELYQVYNSFSKLYKVMRISNTAFFSGNLDWAYHFLCDALQLFRKVGDEKAIGIACNNIGNTLFAMAVQGSKPEVACRCKGKDNPLPFYDEAIEIGQREFDQATASELKADFAQRLADRLFNRSLYLLHIQNNEDAPSNARELALADLSKTRDLDFDVRDFWLEEKLLLAHSEVCFSRLLRRIHGLTEHYHDEELRRVWDAKEMVEEADRFLFAAWNEPTAPLFDSVNRVGRLQQLEAAAVLLELNMGNNMVAARLAMRMFAEDEYLLECTFAGAANALLRLVREEKPWTPMTVMSMRSDFRRLLRGCRRATLDLGKCMIFAIELNERWEGGPLLQQVNANCLSLFDNKCDREDHVGVVAYTVRGDQTLELRVKEQHEDHQRAMLDLATSSTSERVCPALPFAFQIVVDSCASADKDSYLLLLTDGYSWESDSYMSIKWQIERMNRERDTMIHIIIFGLDIEDEEVVEQCKALCTVSKASYYVDITECDDLDAVFASVGALISGQKAKRLRSITMERLAQRKYE